MKTICIDAGHGGHDSGVVGLEGLRECDLNLDIAGRIALKAVSSGWRAMMTRGSDRFVSLEQRSGMSNAIASKADLFLSIHGNGSDNRQAHGVEFFTSRGQTAADVVVPFIERAWRDEFPDEWIRTDWTDGDSDKEAGYAVLRLTHAPAVLVEVGFVSHPETEKLLRDSEYRARIASAIWNGVLAWSAHVDAQQDESDVGITPVHGGEE